jgi:Arc/MetJ family transcription regulator
MVTHMKTTIELPDALLTAAKTRASQEGTTLRALLEEALRRLLAERESEGEPFTLQDASFGGRGLQSHVREGSWEDLRAWAYEGRGG